MEKRPYPQSKSLSRTARERRAQRSPQLGQAGQHISARPGASQTANRANSVDRAKTARSQASAALQSQPAARERARARSAGGSRRGATPNSVSRQDLNVRRKTLRRQRGVNSLKGTWRFGAVGAAAVGLGWVMMQPLWLIHGPEQIRVKGTDTINPQTLHALLALDYPQSLLKVKPQELETILLDGAPINKAHVSRRLFPPGLTVQVAERKPVALAELVANGATDSATDGATSGQGSDDSSQASGAEASSEESEGDRDGTQSSEAQSDGSAEVASKVASNPGGSAASSTKDAKKRGQQVLMDEVGDWIPLERYSGKGQLIELPQLKVLGMRVEYRQAWKELYPSIAQSPVQITEIDWRDPSNMKLKTDLGEAHIGPYTSQFAQQLEVLDKMRSLQQHEDAGKVDFIDLRSPTIPRLKMKS